MHTNLIIESKEGWKFCKNALKPYDNVVYELLYLALHIFGEDYFEYNGDCDYDEDDYSNIKSFVRNNIIDELIK